MPPSRVLLVEDDPAYAQLLAAELSGDTSEFDLSVVSSMAAALDRISNGAADAVLLDLGLPDSAGLASVRKAHRALPHETPLVVLTATDDEELARAAMKEGAQDYLVKGRADRDDIVRALRYALERAAYRRRLTDTEHALRHSEAQLRQAQKMEAIGRLAGGIAHDFNNVLTAIFGYTDLLLDDLPDEDTRRVDVVEIRKAAERAAGLTRQLLAFSRKQVMTPKPIHLPTLLANLETFLSRLIGTDIRLQIIADPHVGNVVADAGQVEQVLMNLAANARDAMPEGGTLTIAVANVDVDAAETDGHLGLKTGPAVKLTISDTGLGIPDRVRQHIFEPFFTTKEKGEGTGLGLATVYGIVKQSGGWIYVDSEEGQGTTFTIYLPRQPEAAPAAG